MRLNLGADATLSRGKLQPRNEGRPSDGLEVFPNVFAASKGNSAMVIRVEDTPRGDPGMLKLGG